MEKFMMETGQNDFFWSPFTSPLQIPTPTTPLLFKLIPTIHKSSLKFPYLKVSIPPHTNKTWNIKRSHFQTIYGWHQLSKALRRCSVEIVKPLPWVETLSWTRSLSSHKLNLIWNNWTQKPSPFFSKSGSFTALKLLPNIFQCGCGNTLIKQNRRVIYSKK